ncbi:MAG: phosphatidate cytidylyltransferase [Frankiales bacterium]|nr:phosphatidate cytidylyltransferase [Frankiales bacterium]
MAITETPPPVSRAGRNLPAAIGVGVTLGGLILGTVYSPYKWLFVVVMVLASAVGTSELVRALQTLSAQPAMVPLLAGGSVMIVLAYRNGATDAFLAFSLTVLACMVWRIAELERGALRDLSASVFTLTYVPFLMCFAALMTAERNGDRLITAFIATVVASDTGGYVAGVLFGKHPMAPSVSPKKSWEGFGGSALFCAVAGAIFFATLLHSHWYYGLLFGLAVVGSATLGDLGESMIKRDIGIKDMGNLLPGHGGIMDRLDSILPTAPVAWLLFAILL